MEHKITETPHFKAMILQCRDCGNDFLLTESEQLFFWRKLLANPTRCQACRQHRRNGQGGGYNDS